MTLNHNEAIARVTVDGLAVACFNSGEKKWDLAFLRLRDRDDCHQLRLFIEGQEVPLPEPVGVITFGTVNGHFPSGFPLGFFDNGPIADRHQKPNPGPETENFRWTIDLEDDDDVPHGFTGLKVPPLEVDLTRTFIHDAVFYTLNVSPQCLILVPNHVNPNPPYPSPNLIGMTNDEIAADIFCNPGGEVFIKVDGDEIFREPHRPGNPWKICLTNLCRLPQAGQHDPPFRKGDFQHIYNVITINGTPHALWGDPRVAGESQCSSDALLEIGRPDCDTARLGSIGTLDLLFS
jgi:hypothetical protein